jgi:hypothetical protein
MICGNVRVGPVPARKTGQTAMIRRLDKFFFLVVGMCVS